MSEPGTQWRGKILVELREEAAVKQHHPSGKYSSEALEHRHMSTFTFSGLTAWGLRLCGDSADGMARRTTSFYVYNLFVPRDSR
jgi:hypothetical protein